MINAIISITSYDLCNNFLHNIVNIITLNISYYHMITRLKWWYPKQDKVQSTEWKAKPVRTHLDSWLCQEKIWKKKGMTTINKKINKLNGRNWWVDSLARRGCWCGYMIWWFIGWPVDWLFYWLISFLISRKNLEHWPVSLLSLAASGQP